MVVINLLCAVSKYTNNRSSEIYVAHRKTGNLSIVVAAIA